MKSHPDYYNPIKTLLLFIIECEYKEREREIESRFFFQPHHPQHFLFFLFLFRLTEPFVVVCYLRLLSSWYLHSLVAYIFYALDMDSIQSFECDLERTRGG